LGWLSLAVLFFTLLVRPAAAQTGGTITGTLRDSGGPRALLNASYPISSRKRCCWPSERRRSHSDPATPNSLDRHPERLTAALPGALDALRWIDESIDELTGGTEKGTASNGHHDVHGAILPSIPGKFP
jgi:hypothetical protein